MKTVKKTGARHFYFILFYYYFYFFITVTCILSCGKVTRILDLSRLFTETTPFFSDFSLNITELLILRRD